LSIIGAVGCTPLALATCVVDGVPPYIAIALRVVLEFAALA
jgi:hypothetical protein